MHSVALHFFFLTSWQQRVHPDSDAEQARVVRLHDFLIRLSRPLAPLPAASGANAAMTIQMAPGSQHYKHIISFSSLPGFWVVVGVLAVKEAVPYLDEEAAVVRLVHEGLGVVTVVLLVSN